MYAGMSDMETSAPLAEILVAVFDFFSCRSLELLSLSVHRILLLYMNQRVALDPILYTRVHTPLL